ncbi:MAG: hypothetical protein JW767_03235 [Thermoleophilia bacterium]|nr:hypothetical protein [Thermoleophilia bacterium]
MIFDPDRLHVKLEEGTLPSGPVAPRRYTYTHSDLTGHLFLTIGAEYDRRVLRALQVRLERDEVLGEWLVDGGEARLELHMAAQGGLPLFGTGALRRRIFMRVRPLVLAALRYGDRALTAAHPELDAAPVVARFTWRDGRDDHELWGRWSDD